MLLQLKTNEYGSRRECLSRAPQGQAQLWHIHMLRTSTTLNWQNIAAHPDKTKLLMNPTATLLVTYSGTLQLLTKTHMPGRFGNADKCVFHARQLPH